MNEILVTSYQNPDLDGTACAVGYAEYLQKEGLQAIAAIFGTLHRETEFVLQSGSFEGPAHAEEMSIENMDVILVDASDATGIAKNIKLSQVTEVIDHRKVHHADDFKNAQIQIELVGSAATLIAEKFHSNNTSISGRSALLLYAAIVSNTINFQATVTTERDKEMAQWLKSVAKPSDDFPHKMFQAKSQLTEPLELVFEHDFALIPLGSKSIGIVQLEIVDVEDFVKNNLGQIQSLLKSIKTTRSLDMIFLTLIDVEKARNFLIAIDQATKDILTKALSVEFVDSIAERDGILMRKQITPLLKETLDKS